MHALPHAHLFHVICSSLLRHQTRIHVPFRTLVSCVSVMDHFTSSFTYLTKLNQEVFPKLVSTSQKDKGKPRFCSLKSLSREYRRLRVSKPKTDRPRQHQRWFELFGTDDDLRLPIHPSRRRDEGYWLPLSCYGFQCQFHTRLVQLAG